jgi:hypothetical protein
VAEEEVVVVEEANLSNEPREDRDMQKLLLHLQANGIREVEARVLVLGRSLNWSF